MFRFFLCFTVLAGCFAGFASAQENVTRLPVPEFRPASPLVTTVSPFPSEGHRSPVFLFDRKNRVFLLTVSTNDFEFYELEESEDLKEWSTPGGKIRGNGSLRTFQFLPEEMASFFLRVFRS